MARMVNYRYAQAAKANQEGLHDYLVGLFAQSHPREEATQIVDEALALIGANIPDESLTREQAAMLDVRGITYPEEWVN